MSISSKIRDLAARYTVPYSRIIVDEDGIGGGVVDHLKGVKGFTANSTPLPSKNTAVEKPNYANLKAQCSYLLADYVNHHRMAVRLDVEGQALEEVRQHLTEKLEAIKAKDPDSDKKLAIELKDKVKVLLGRSPDHADTLVMRMWVELRPAASVAFTPPPVSTVKPYYPKLGF